MNRIRGEVEEIFFFQQIFFPLKTDHCTSGNAPEDLCMGCLFDRLFFFQDIVTGSANKKACFLEKGSVNIRTQFVHTGETGVFTVVFSVI